MSTRRTITDDWIASVRRAIDEQGLSQNAVAKRVGTTSAAMSLILGGAQQSSKLVEPISRLLKIDLPGLDVMSPRLQRLVDVAGGLSKENIELLVSVAAGMTSEK